MTQRNTTLGVFVLDANVVNNFLSYYKARI